MKKTLQVFVSCSHSRLCLLIRQIVAPSLGKMFVRVESLDVSIYRNKFNDRVCTIFQMKRFGTQFQNILVGDIGVQKYLSREMIIQFKKCQVLQEISHGDRLQHKAIFIFPVSQIKMKTRENGSYTLVLYFDIEKIFINNGTFYDVAIFLLNLQFIMFILQQ